MTTVFNVEATSSAYNARTVQQQGSGSDIIGINNENSACMSHNPEDFVGNLQEFKRTIKDFGGQNHYNMHIGTIKWHW